MNNDADRPLTFQERQLLFSQLDLEKRPNAPIGQKSPRLPPRTPQAATNGTPTTARRIEDVPPPMPPRKPSVCPEQDLCDDTPRPHVSKRRETRRAIRIKKSPSKRQSTIARSPSPAVRRSPSPSQLVPSSDRFPSSPDNSPESTLIRPRSPSVHDRAPDITSKPPQHRTSMPVDNDLPPPALPPRRHSYDVQLKVNQNTTRSTDQLQYNYAKPTGNSVPHNRKISPTNLNNRPAPLPPPGLAPYRIQKQPSCIDCNGNHLGTSRTSKYAPNDLPPVNLATHPGYRPVSPRYAHRLSGIPPPIPDTLPPPRSESPSRSPNPREDAHLGYEDNLSEYDDDDDIYGAISTTERDDFDFEQEGDFMIIQKPPAPAAATLKPGSTGFREYWHERAEVVASGILEGDQIGKKERGRQEAMYEILTTELSFRKSLEILEKQFIDDNLFNCYFDEEDLEGSLDSIFGNIHAIISCSKRLVDCLKDLYKDKVTVDSITSIIKKFADHNFEAYITYCAHTSLQQNILAAKRKNDEEFRVFLEGKEKALMGHNLQSYLVQPMQRICRMPLLISAVLSKTEEDTEDQIALAEVYKNISSIVQKCNEEARKSEIRRAMTELQERCDFDKIKKSMSSFTDKPDRLILKEGDVFKLKFKGSRIQAQKIYLWLFTDCLVIGAKLDPKDDTKLTLLEHCPRQLIKIVGHFQLPYGISSKKKNPTENIFHLQLLGSGPSARHIIQCASVTEKERWLEVLKPSVKEQENPDETIYEEWDVPLVKTKFDYKMINNDDLELYEGEVCKVLKKYRDGWCYGVRERDGKKGWFPFSYMEEIDTDHSKYREMRRKYEMMESLIAHPKAEEMFSTIKKT